jgi:acetyl esterase/lipase
VVVEELSLRTLPDRRVHAWLARPQRLEGKAGGVLALHGHGGTGEQVVRGQSLYWYGRALAASGLVVIAPDIGQHELQQTDWSLMGERTWDAWRCVDYLVTRPEVDTNRLAVAGLSLGGETTMYVAALDERLRLACSSGWLTTVENMKHGHCPCWNFPGLEAHFDFSDIFACVAPRGLVFEIGELERAPGGFPVPIAREAFAEIRAAYAVFAAAAEVELVVHPGGHVFEGTRFRDRLAELGAAPEALDAVAWLEQKTASLLRGCQVDAADGTKLFTPDGQGNYRALWTRDFAYMVENAGDLIPPGDVEAALRFLIRGVRADGAAPDRVRPDGVAVYVAGPEDNPLGEPNIDNAQFLVIAVHAHLNRSPATARFRLVREWSEPLQRAMNYIPRSPAGLVFNDPQKPHSPYGFTDTVGKTGELLFESLLYWQAARRLAHWLDLYGEPVSAAELRQRAALIETNLVRLWDEGAGAFVAASQDCRQVDIWGNAYALWLDFPLGAKRDRVLDFLVQNRDRFVWRGQVRHLLRGEHWQRLLTPVAPERYQNGAYWATASGWVIWALAQRDTGLARRMWAELIADFRHHGVFECVNEGYRQLDSYVVSAANPLAALRRLGH